MEFVEVSKDTFYATMGPLNVHPRPERDASFWHLQTNFGLVGKTTPGYMCRGPESYQVRSDLLK